MRVNQLPQTSQAQPRGGLCVVIAIPSLQAPSDAGWQRCLESVRRHSPGEIPVEFVVGSTAAINAAIDRLANADVVVLGGPCVVFEGWLERLREAARADTNTATASALADVGGALAVCPSSPSPGELVALVAELGERSRRLRPRLRHAVGPCVYVRREALELVGPLDQDLELSTALELDFAQRCLLSGLAHVAADDVLVEALAPEQGIASEHPSATLLKRYPYLESDSGLAESQVLAEAIQAARSSPRQLGVTIDARALDGAVTGTQVHIVELIIALAQTGRLALRVLVRTRRIDQGTLALLGNLPDTELLDEDELEPDTPPSPIYHRPQQAFAAEDVALAVRLGERIVLSQLDLIAYRNPGYFPDAAAWEDYRLASRHGLSAAERVIVFSEHTRRELLGDALVEAPRIRVVPPGLDHRRPLEQRRPAALSDATAETLADGFLLCLGTDFRHKNRLFALRLLEHLRAEHAWQGNLVLAGTHVPRGSSLELERAFLEAHPEVAEAVVLLGSVDEQEKAWLMGRASAVVYPSAYEGFGLVPFESALAGVPCLFAAQSSLAEAAPGETATLIPWDAAGSAALAYPLLSDPELRERHVESLAEAARALTWKAAAQQLVEIYHEAASAPVREAGTLSRDLVRRERRLTEAHEVVIDRLIGEREHAQRMYDDLNAEVGSGLSLIGPNGTLPDELQRGLLAISARPLLRGALFGALARVFIAVRGLGRTVRDPRRPAP
jgi:glycosyltransferase involved in cell wall biosynthesis